MDHYPCTSIPEFAAYCADPSIKNALLAETGGEREAFVERAAQTLATCVLRPPGFAPIAKPTLLAKLYDQGYTQEAITNALAAAWFDETDTFSLPSRSMSRILRSNWFLLGLPLLLALLSLLELGGLLRARYPEQLATVLWFAPIIGLLGLVLAAIFHLLLKGILALMERMGR